MCSDCVSIVPVNNMPTDMIVQPSYNGENLPAPVATEVMAISPQEALVVDTFKKDKGISTAIVAGSSMYGGLELGKKLGVKFSGVVEKQFLEFTKDFCKKPFAALPQKAVAGIKWGVGGLFAYLAGAIVLRDANKDGEADILGSVKKLFKPTPPPPKAEPIIIEG